MFCKKNNAWVQARNQKFFRAGEVLWNYNTLISILSKTKKKGPTGKNFGFFWMKNVTRWTQSRPFFPKSGYFFLIFRKVIGASSTPPSMAACLWVLLNLHHYHWISLNILKNAWINCSDYALIRLSYMFVRLLKEPQALNVPGLWIWPSCISKGYTELW